MTVQGVTPRLVALMCLLGACALLLLVYCGAPVRPRPADPTPVVVIATLVAAPTLATPMAGPALPSRTPPPRELLVLTPTRTAAPSTSTVTVAPTEEPTKKPMTEQRQKG